MNSSTKFLFTLFISLALASCVTQKKYASLESQLKQANDLVSTSKNNLDVCNATVKGKDDQIALLKNQLNDCKEQRDKQLTQVGDLTVLSQSANNNINETLAQLAAKDQYIHRLQAAKSKADSINLALAVNLKSVLKDGLDDNDVEVKVDKTVVLINLSDKMLFNTASYHLTAKAKEVLGKIATIVKSRPDVEVMVEGYTDNRAIHTNCIEDNWDLSAKRATSVVRVLQKNYQVDPNRLIAAGRGQYNTLATNDTPEGRALNRRTRIVIMPKLDQFYDLLAPTKASK